MSTRRSYCDALDGQMHVTEAGDGQPIILLPWFPRSALMYADELAVFAALGFRAIALDLMGRGNSVTSNPNITITRQADNVERVLTSMKIENPIVLGGHYSSQIAVELALRPITNARALVIDGGVLIDQATSDDILMRMARVKTALLPQEDGAHREFLWANAANICDIYAPGFKVTADTSQTVYRLISDYLAAYLQVGGDTLAQPPVDAYPFADSLSKLTRPAVFSSADTETLAAAVEPMAAIYGGPVTRLIFEGGHPIHFPQRAGEYAKGLCNALSELLD